MRRTFIISVMYIFCTVLYGQTMNNDILECDSICVFEGKNKNDLFLAVNQYLNESIIKNNYSSQKVSSDGATDRYNGVNYSKGNINMADKEAGIIMANGNFSASMHQNKNLFGDWSAYIDYTLSIKIKDERMKVSIQVPTVTFAYSNNPEPESVEIKYLFPECTLKSGMTRLYSIPKKAPKLIPDVGKNVQEFMSTLINGITKNIAEDDF